MSRTYNVIKNVKFVIVAQILNLILNFVSRTFFVKFLGSDYLGVSGLFTNILTMLSFAELGIGNAIVYSMYKPLAQHDTEKIKSLIQLYKRLYIRIGLVVFIVGILIMPALKTLIKGEPNITDNLYVIYFLYLFNSSISYFFVYRTTIITADQKNYIVVMYQQIVQIAQCIFQIVFLYFTHNFIIYLLVQIVCSIGLNVWLSIKAVRIYPYLKEKHAKELDSDIKQQLFTNVKALAIYKFASTILNGTDSILVSALVGITEVGYYSNYMLVLNAVRNLLNKITDSFTASIGNMNAIENMSYKRKIFDEVFLICAWLFGFTSMGMLLMFNDLIILWIGKEYVMPMLTVFAIILHFYVNGVHYIAYTYRTTLGLFVEGWIAPVMAAILNLILSIVLNKYLGMAGIFFATSIARFFTTGIVDPVLIYKRIFKENPMKYYVTYFKFVLINIIVYGLSRYLLSGFVGISVKIFILKVLFITVFYNMCMLILLWKNETFRGLLKIVRDRFGKKI